MSAYYDSESLKKECVAKASALLEGDSALASLHSGIPVELIEAAKGLRSALSQAEAADFPQAFAAAVRPGADLSHASFALMEWLLSDPRQGLITLAKGERTRSVLRLLAAYFGKTALHGSELGKMRPGGELILAFAFLRREVSLWKSWTKGGLDDWRASRAALEMWKCRDMSPKDLSRAMLACRGAHGDEGGCAQAQAKALKTALSYESLEHQRTIYLKEVNG